MAERSVSARTAARTRADPLFRLNPVATNRLVSTTDAPPTSRSPTLPGESSLPSTRDLPWVRLVESGFLQPTRHGGFTHSELFGQLLVKRCLLGAWPEPLLAEDANHLSEDSPLDLLGGSLLDPLQESRRKDVREVRSRQLRPGWRPGDGGADGTDQPPDLVHLPVVLDEGVEEVRLRHPVAPELVYEQGDVLPLPDSPMMTTGS